MSIQQTPDAPISPPKRSGCLVAFLALLGIVMVLPGLCSLLVIISMGSGGNFRDGGLVLLWVVTFAIAAGGIALLVYASRTERGARAPLKDDAGPPN